MFLDKTIKDNNSLIQCAFNLHQNGLISPDTYILDLDMIRRNAQMMLDEARAQGVKLFFMTKQFGIGSPEARAATPDLCNNIQVQGRLPDLPHVGAGAVSARLRGCRTAVPQLFRTWLKVLGCFCARRGKYAGSIGTSGCHPGSA